MPIDVTLDPLQSDCVHKTVLEINGKEGDFFVSARAEYIIDAILESKKNYSSGWQGMISPIDYRQRDRWYFFKYSEESPVSADYIHKHSAQQHVPG